MQDGVHDALAEMAGAAKKAKKLPACKISQVDGCRGMREECGTGRFSARLLLLLAGPNVPGARKLDGGWVMYPTQLQAQQG